MKYKKDLPRKYWKYVLWAEVNKQTQEIINGPFMFRETAVHFNKRPGRKCLAVQPVLCLPLSMIYHFHGCEADQNEMIQLERKSARCNTP